MNRIYRAICLLIIATSFFQCQKELGYSGTGDAEIVIPTPVPVNPEPITAHLQGNIVDENN